MTRFYKVSLKLDFSRIKARKVFAQAEMVKWKMGNLRDTLFMYPCCYSVELQQRKQQTKYILDKLNDVSPPILN